MQGSAHDRRAIPEADANRAGRLAAALATAPRARHVVLIDLPAAVAPVQGALHAAGAPLHPCRVALCGAGAEGWPPWCRVSAVADRAAVLDILEAEAAAWPMGTQLHPIGSAVLAAAATLAALAAGMHRDTIHSAVMEATSRRVQCVHCKTVGEAVPYASRHACGGCGTVLKIRALFSQRHQAFLGVADPEALA